jgi:chloramphenicol-sensitive protein RarD
MPPPMNTAMLQAALAFVTWGLFPLYFLLIPQVPPLEVVLHRSTWALLLVLGILAYQGRWSWLQDTLKQPKRLWMFSASALLLSCNWLLYVYAVQSGHVAEASLGYFINPLLNVLLGVVVLRERLRPLQWLAVALAALGVMWLTWQAGRLPWIALALAASFGLYGLIRKTASLGALEGLVLENILLAPLVLPALLWVSVMGSAFIGGPAGPGVLLQGPASQIGWLMLGGPLTAFPLLMFAAGARKLPLATLGMLQYIGPTLQLILAVWVFHEPFSSQRLIGFAFIWTALLVMSADGLGLRLPGAKVAQVG